jgi:virulence factor Mce-like protein
VTRRGAPSLVASPVLVGAVTVLVAVIAVFIAYQANQGLPFVPTYDLRAELPSGGKLVRGNDVRVGGFRVGTIEEIQPDTATVEGGERAIAVVDLKLDKTVEPLPSDTLVRVRPRSVLGLKYLELRPGRSRETYEAGDTIPLRFSSEPLELEDVLSMFDRDTRPAVQEATTGFGDALAGRGASINTAIAALNPFFSFLTPVMQDLADPATRLDNLFRQLGRSAAQVAPVAREQAELFTLTADTFAAISRSPRALEETIEKSPPTLDVAIRSLRAQRPFLADFAAVSRDLEPAAAELVRSLPPINAALGVGTPILRRQPQLSVRLASLNRELRDLFENPSTLLALRDLRTALTVIRPAIEYIGPYQTVCNYWNYYWHGLGEHQSTLASDITPPLPAGGTVQTQGVKFVNLFQPNNYGSTETSRPPDLSPREDPRVVQPVVDPTTGQPVPQAKHRLYAQPYQPAVDARGNADCQIGQQGYIKGPYNYGFERYGRGTLRDGTPTGGNWSVTKNFDWLSGPTYTAKRLGIGSLSDARRLLGRQP